jgi:hypothetical protein
VHADDALTAEVRPTLIDGQLFGHQFRWSYVSSGSRLDGRFTELGA